jgi:hypothetical protein
MLLADYGTKRGLDLIASSARIVFYYGVLSLPPPLSICGSELDSHFNFPVFEAIETVNSYFVEQLHALIEQ